jgi:hypothetical protein
MRLHSSYLSSNVCSYHQDSRIACDLPVGDSWIIEVDLDHDIDSASHTCTVLLGGVSCVQRYLVEPGHQCSLRLGPVKPGYRINQWIS